MKNPCSDHPHTHRLIQPPLADLTDQLRRNDRKITAPRQAILDVLRRHQQPLSNKEIHTALGKDECDLATVYRNVRTLESMRIVQRYDFGDGVARYELAADGSTNHHHHLVCQKCSLVIELEECFPAELEAALARRYGFTEIHHRLEFFGVCAKCHAGGA